MKYSEGINALRREREDATVKLLRERLDFSMTVIGELVGLSLSGVKLIAAKHGLSRIKVSPCFTCPQAEACYTNNNVVECPVVPEDITIAPAELGVKEK
jgi:hypothetical protein